MSEPFSGILGPVVEESTSNTTEFAVAEVAALLIGLKSKTSLSSYFVPEGEMYDGILA